MSERYQWVPNYGDDEFVRCVECGVLIDNTRIHDRWHEMKETR